MLRLAQRSSVLGTSMRLLASTSVTSKHDRNVSTKKAVVFNMGGTVLPAMAPVITRCSHLLEIPEDELTTKVFVEGDEKLTGQVEPAILSRHGSEEGNFADLVTAIKGIKAEGLKTALISDSKGLNKDLIPLDMELFDAVVPELQTDIGSILNMDSSEVVYLDNSAENLKLAADQGVTTVNVGDVGAALTELESHLKVPLKEFLPGLTWTYYNSAHSPYTNGKENMLYVAVVMSFWIYVVHFTFRNVFKIGGPYEPQGYDPYDEH